MTYVEDLSWYFSSPFSWSAQSWTKHLETFSLFSTISLYYKWNGTRLLSPEGECTSCVTSYRTTEDFRKFQENPWNTWIWWQVPSHPTKSQKHSVEKPVLLNFVNLSPTFCPRLQALNVCCKHPISRSFLDRYIILWGWTSCSIK